jgi:trans-2-enoyl-CoA reductase
MLCIKESCFEPVASNRFFKIFKNANGQYMGIVFDDDGIDDIIKAIKKTNRKISVYVFSLDSSTRDEEFESISELVDLKPIPASILNAYKEMFK